jgi:hypothetical protein
VQGGAGKLLVKTRKCGLKETGNRKFPAYPVGRQRTVCEKSAQVLVGQRSHLRMNRNSKLLADVLAGVPANA